MNFASLHAMVNKMRTPAIFREKKLVLTTMQVHGLET